MTNKERKVQRALGLLNTYHFAINIAPVYDRGLLRDGTDIEDGSIRIEAIDFDSACIQLEIEMKRKYPDAISFEVKRLND